MLKRIFLPVLLMSSIFSANAMHKDIIMAGDWESRRDLTITYYKSRRIEAASRIFSPYAFHGNVVGERNGQVSR